MFIRMGVGIALLLVAGRVPAPNQVDVKTAYSPENLRTAVSQSTELRGPGAFASMRPMESVCYAHCGHVDFLQGWYCLEGNETGWSCEVGNNFPDPGYWCQESFNNCRISRLDFSQSGRLLAEASYCDKYGEEIEFATFGHIDVRVTE